MRRSNPKNSGGGHSARTYKHGDFLRICDVSGRVVLASETRWQWDNIIARIEDWTPRNPQDFVRGIPDRQFVPNARPEAADVFVDPNDITRDDL